MALIDVSDALEDPDYVDEFTYIRTEVVTAPTGRGITKSQQTFTGIGSIQAHTGQELHRMGDAEFNSGMIKVITKELLTAGSDDYTADVVLWKGAGYTVTNIEDWSNYGEGYVRATCELRPLRGAPL